MESPTEADERVLLDVFNFHPLTVEDCRENRHYPKIEEFGGYIYFIVHGVRADTSPDRFNTIELDGFLGAVLEVDGPRLARRGLGDCRDHERPRIHRERELAVLVAVRAARFKRGAPALLAMHVDDSVRDGLVLAIDDAADHACRRVQA